MGWCEEEFDLLEQPFRRRGRRADEMLELLRALWTGEVIEHHGEFYDIPRLEMNPAVTEPVPVYVGGISDAAFRRAARHDGWVSDMMTSEQLGDSWRRIEAYRREAGTSDRPFAVVGSTKDVSDIDGYHRLAELGVTDLLTLPWVFYSGFTDDLSKKIEGINRFAEDVLARVKD
jgi:alkanesulfonate monooxygenase SsuD/methylene tetrahydromethanopterin reductase-like flavin-dependent oxidoreductase (luciferase family)